MGEVPDQTWAWPSGTPTSGDVLLPGFRGADAAAAMALARDPYVPQIGTLRPNASHHEAMEQIEAQRRRLDERAGFSFSVADTATDACLGFAGLWLQTIETGTATAGCAVLPDQRGRGIATAALRALTAFAWMRPPVVRVELHIEPRNTASLRAAARAGYTEGALLSAAHDIGGRMRYVVAFATTRPAEPSQR